MTTQDPDEFEDLVLSRAFEDDMRAANDDLERHETKPLREVVEEIEREEGE